MSFTVVNDGTAQPPADTGARLLVVRILSAAVMLPAAVAAVVSGTPFFEILVVAAAVAMAWEWSRICAEGRFAREGFLFVALVLIAVAAAAAGRFDIALVLVVTNTGAFYFAARDGEEARAVWSAAGMVVIALPVVCLIWLESASAAGWPVVIWLFAAVWATDTGAYVFGRLIGGVRLVPRISPKKTWAGLIGGAICAAAWSAGWGWWLGAPSPTMLAVAGALTAVVAQAGDIGISLVKRRFGVKDASALIPGHGGMLDRVDGLTTTAPLLALVVLATEGNRAPWLGV